ncbi:MAG: DNA (cytosine-5-)-methyltransferase [Flavobacteriaceae bacterium]|nr:DNA (cytosine-5-)-methyltransferase [Flavobacteriaceae bacterium]
MMIQSISNEKDQLIPFPNPIKPKFSFIDLFAGVGGFRIALQQLGGECIFSSEWDKNAQITYQKNFGEIPLGDISKNEVKERIPNHFDILCAGFPCQSFSIAGYKKGFSDSRGQLFFEIEKITQKRRPRVLFLENVKNILSHNSGKTFQTIKTIIEKKLGYKLFYSILNATTHANIPQNRERVFMVGFNLDYFDHTISFSFPNEVPLTNNIHSIIGGGKKDKSYYYDLNHKYYPSLIKQIRNYDTVYQWRRVYIRENKNNLCPTLTANMGTGGHNVPIIKDSFGIRKLTPKECFSFQGFPMSLFLLPEIPKSQLYRQAGNSVVIPIVSRIGKKILNVI